MGREIPPTTSEFQRATRYPLWITVSGSGCPAAGLLLVSLIPHASIRQRYLAYVGSHRESHIRTESISMEAQRLLHTVEIIPNGINGSADL